MRTLFGLMIAFIFTLLLATNIYGEESIELPKGLRGISIGGLWYLSYQNRRSSDSYYNYFKVKRAYINIKKTITSWLSGRITPDTHQENNGDYKMRLKYAYADFKLPDFVFFFKPHMEWGIVHRTWLDFEEHINYYRLQDPMFMERNGLFNSADLGFTFFALLGGEVSKDYQNMVNKKYPGKYGSIALGLYNGGGYHAEEKNQKKEPEIRITIRPLPERLPGLQLSYFGLFAHGNIAEEPEWQINTGFLSFENRRFVITGTYYTGKGTMNGEVDVQGVPKEKTGYSGFAELKIPEKRLSLVGRFDWFDSDKNIDDDEVTRIIAGLAIHLHGHSKILIDYDVARYSQPGRGDDPRMQVTTEVHF